jgi:hypothetical protein
MNPRTNGSDLFSTLAIERIHNLPRRPDPDLGKEGLSGGIGVHGYAVGPSQGPRIEVPPSTTSKLVSEVKRDEVVEKNRTPSLHERPDGVHPENDVSGGNRERISLRGPLDRRPGVAGQLRSRPEVLLHGFGSPEFPGAFGLELMQPGKKKFSYAANSRKSDPSAVDNDAALNHAVAPTPDDSRAR